MNTCHRFTHGAAGSVLAACLLLLAPSASPEAATLHWTGSGASALWSDAANWDALRAPVNGDELVFGTASARLDSVFDLSLSFASLVFAANAPAYALHVQGSGATLSLSGVGLRNLTAGSGPIRQDLYADAGTVGGSIVFTGSSGINLGTATDFRPVNLTARGAATATGIGGHILFQDDAATSASTYDALRAEGASAVGGLGGDITFRGNALATRSATVTVTGGMVGGALGAQASFSELARADAIFNVLAGENGGLGARADFSGHATASVYATFNNRGANSADAGVQAITTFRGDSILAGSVNNEAGAGADFYGGLLEFRDRASHDSSGLDPSLGIVQIRNGGSALNGARSAGTVFRDDSFIRGTQLLIVNTVQAEGAEAGSAGGTTEFRDRARAGQVTILNEGAATAGAVGGWTFFRNQATAESANITSKGGTTSGAAGGNLRFADDATAGNATLASASGTVTDALGGTNQFLDRATASGAQIVNQGGSVAGAFGGTTDFGALSSAGHATVINAAGEVSGTGGGSTRFSGSAVAGTAYLSNNAALSVSGGMGGSTVFSDDANAQHAIIDNFGGFFTGDNASTSFQGRASAGQAGITNFGGRAASAFGGITRFDGFATAGAASLVMAGGGSSGALGGFAVFYGDSQAGTATLDARGASVLGAVGGRAQFFDRATASGAHITIGGSPIDHVLGAEGGAVSFANASSAGDAVIDVTGNSFAGGGVGALRFTDTATAGRATFTLAAGQTRGGALSFEGASASALASADSAHITNKGSSTAAARGLGIGGQTSFVAYSTAGSAAISNEAGFAPGITSFFATSTAGDASLINRGGAAGEDGGATQFNNSSSAERAVIVNQAGARGSSGFDAAGVTRFVDQASAGQARITAEGSTSSSAVGGLISFGGNAQPANATLIAEGGTGGGTGGRIVMASLTNASQARVILNAGDGSPGAGGQLDISGITPSGIAIGSLEGGGIVSLGSGKNLTLWSSTARTNFSGLIRDSGSITVTGGAQLSLTGANTYTGGTRIGDGVNAGSGKLVAANTTGSATGTGEVVIARGGTLGGSGFIAGPVTLMDGGAIVPGDPVTLTLNDSLTWNGGGIIRLALGADSAGSDHLIVHRLIRGTDGPFVFDLVNFGMTAGATYEFLHFDSLVGFSASDFNFTGLSGTFALRDGGLAFTTAAVPEPGAALLLLLGLPLVLGARRWRSQFSCPSSVPACRPLRASISPAATSPAPARR